MSRTSTITCAAVLAAMTQIARMKNGQITLRDVGAVFSISAEGAAHHVNKLLAAGDVMIVRRGAGGNPALYALTTAPAQYEGQIVPPRRVNLLSAPPMVGHEARLRAQAALAMTARRA